MTVYLVDNSDNTIMGIFKNKKKAKALVSVGKKRWNEKWYLTPLKLNKIEPWILAGNESYKQRKSK
jgi:hypothetical protein